MPELPKQIIEFFKSEIEDSTRSMVVNMLPSEILIAQAQHVKTMMMMLSKMGYEIKFDVIIQPHVPETDREEKPAK